MKKIYMVQPCDVHGYGENESAYLPYASGLLIAHAFRDSRVKSSFDFGRFIYKKENIDEAISSMEDPKVVGFSTYVWNYEYNKEFAKRLKEKYPACVTVFGGHNINNSSAEQMEKYPFIDFLIHGEGEIAFLNVLLGLIGDVGFADIPNISYRENGTVRKNEAAPICTLDYPSPYLDGWFDEILEKDGIRFSVLFETNRGCPFKCAYCDWGSIGLAMRQFSLERVKAELRWFGEHKIDFCFCIDSNFGMYPRDFDIVDEFLRVKDETGFPVVFKCCTTEGGGMNEFNINKKLNDCKIFKGASLALQTLSDEALKNIGRKNMSIEKFGKLSAMYNEAGIPAYSEVIYGLPGETYETFSENLNRIIESGTTKSFFMHYCELLMNSRLGQPENVEKFKIKSAKIPYTQFHSTQDSEITEYQTIIVSTYSMSYDMWIKTCIFGLVAQCFYFMGMLQYVTQYLHLEHGVSYKEFFEKLILFAENTPDSVMGTFYGELYSKLGALKRGEMITVSHRNAVFGCIDYPFEEAMYLEVISRAGEFFGEITPLIRSFAEDDENLSEVISYQYLMLRKPFDTGATAHFGSDFHTYFGNIAVNRPSALQKRSNSITVKNGVITNSLEEYATEIVWYGRKNSKLGYTDGELTQIFD